MEKNTVAELDSTIRKCILEMKKIESFDSHSILNYIYFKHRAIFDKMVKEDKPRSLEEWISFRRRIYSRVKASSGDLIQVVEKKQSWSVLYDGNYGPCTYWRKLTKAERDAIKAAALKTIPKQSMEASVRRKKPSRPTPTKAQKKPAR